MANTNGASKPVVIAPQSEVYRGIQIHLSKGGYWFIDQFENIQRAKTIESTRCQIDIVQLVLSTDRRCEP